MIVDACEGGPLLAALERLQLLPAAVYCTHHHSDHTAGLPDLLKIWPQLPVFCHPVDLLRIEGATEGVEDGMPLCFCGEKGQVLYTPGHTMGSLCYLVGEYLFTGDTLFGTGCGRVFEGSFTQMATSLQRLAALPKETKVCFGHEYTLANLDFTLFVEPENQALLSRKQAAEELRQQGLPTAPVPLFDELCCNPFLRCDDPLIMAIAQQRFGAVSDAYGDIFTALRRAKDTF